MGMVKVGSERTMGNQVGYMVYILMSCVLY